MEKATNSKQKVADANTNQMEFLDEYEQKPKLNTEDDITDLTKSPTMSDGNDSSTDSCVSTTLAYNLETYLAERRLILLVKNHSALYDRQHRRFNDVDYKERIWQVIGQKMSLPPSECVSTWAELRYEYQRFVRRLRNYHTQIQRCPSQASARPIMMHEQNMIFLYAHVAQFPLRINTQKSKRDTSAVDDDVTIIDVQPVAIIDVDAEYSNEYKITVEQQRLIDAVVAYPHLYDPHHESYGNYRHRGIIWGAISNELHEKATKLMKSWLHLQTRYEWELLYSNNNNNNNNSSSSQNSGNSSSAQLIKQLSFLEPHIQQTPNTVCKVSRYLKEAWVDPIEQFRNVLNLINAVKTMPELAQMVDNYQNNENVPTRYHELWLRVSSQVSCSHQRCEVTWLTLRNFYLELAEMRKVGYQLQDKWFFENIIDCFYKLLAARSERQTQKQAAKVVSPPQLESPGTSTSFNSQPLPMAIIYPAATHYSNAPTSISALPINSTNRNSITNTTNSAAGGGASYTLPRISASISVVPKPAATTASSVPSTVAKPSYVTIKPKPLALPIPATVQLARMPTMSTVPTAPTASTILGVRPGVVRPVYARPIHQPIHTPPAVLTLPNVTSTPVVRTVLSSRPGPPRTGLQVTVSTASSAPTVRTVCTVPTVITMRSCPLRSGHQVAVPTMSTTSKAPIMSTSRYDPSRSGMQVMVRPKPSLPPSSIATAKSSTITSTASSIVGSTIIRAIPAAPAAGAYVQPIGVKKPLTFTKITPSQSLAKPKPLPMSVRKDKVLLPTKPIIVQMPSIFRKKSNELGTKPAPSKTFISIDKSSSGNSKAKSVPLTSSLSPKVGINVSSPSGPPLMPTSTTKVSSNPSNANICNTAKLDLTPTETSLTKAIKITAIPTEIEMKVQFRDNPTTGRYIHVEGPAVPFSPNLSMPRTAIFIREVMAIPQLHNPVSEASGKNADIWYQISKKYHMPEHVCRGIWRFLAANMSFFPEIAPMAQLMQPFKTNLKVWEKSHRLFGKFDEIARKHQWMNHKEKLPALLQLFSKHDHLYLDLRRPRPGEKCQTVREVPIQCTEEDGKEVWKLARKSFPHINHSDVWFMFKFAFKTYMEDLERGIENPWPQNWWHSLEQLKFLVNVRYHPLEPYYYIVHNKFSEEVKRCAMYEVLMQTDADDSLMQSLENTSPMPWETAEAKELFAKQRQEKQRAQQENQEQHADVAEQEKEKEKPLLAEDELRLVKVQPSMTELCSTNKTLPNIDVYELTRLMLCNPNTYCQATNAEKRRAWMKVANALGTTISECRSCLEHAMRQMRSLMLVDHNRRCLLSHKYYRHLNDIYMHVMAGGKITSRRPEYISQILYEPTELAYPARFVPEINMFTSKPSLVVKNWAYAANNLPNFQWSSVRTRLQRIFDKYASLAGIECPNGGPIPCSNNTIEAKPVEDDSQQEQNNMEQEQDNLQQKQNDSQPKEDDDEQPRAKRRKQEQDNLQKKQNDSQPKEDNDVQPSAKRRKLQQ